MGVAWFVVTDNEVNATTKEDSLVLLLGSSLLLLLGSKLEGGGTLLNMIGWMVALTVWTNEVIADAVAIKYIV